MVNMFLNYIKAMRPNFIAVDAMASDDPKKKAVSMAGIREVIKTCAPVCLWASSLPEL